jgi:hypothetical protein
VGKTNLSLNLARDLRARYPRVTLVDLDIVNPYFRSSESLDFLVEKDVALLGPVRAIQGSNLDTPSLAPGIDNALRAAGEQHAVIVDVGGDPDGARALGRFATMLDAMGQRDGRALLAQGQPPRPPAPSHPAFPYQMLYVVNQNRPAAADVAGNLGLLLEIEQASKLELRGIIGNTHLKQETTVEGIVASVPDLLALAAKVKLPLVAVTAPRDLASAVQQMLATTGETQDIPVYPVDILVTTPWEQKPLTSP